MMHMNIRSKVSYSLGIKKQMPILLILLLLVSSCSLFEEEESYTEHQLEFLEKVRERGSLRVWAYYDMEFTREGKLDEQEKKEQREQIASMHQKLKSELDSRELPYNVPNELEYAPAMVLSVREETLKFLFDSDLIKKVREVRTFNTRDN